MTALCGSKALCLLTFKYYLKYLFSSPSNALRVQALSRSFTWALRKESFAVLRFWAS